MDTIKENISIDSFFQNLELAHESVLLSDYDGTLAPFCVDRHEALPYPGVRKRLNQLLDNDRTRLVIISGRAISDLTPLLGLKRMPEIWGSHGAEHVDPKDGYSCIKMSPEAVHALESINDWSERDSLMPYLEKKPFGFAFHWRGLPAVHRDLLRQQVFALRSQLKGVERLDFLEFDGGIEFREPGINKGRAVKALLSRLTNHTVVACLGDDLTDEDAFRALGGRGLRVLVKGSPRPTAADIRLDPPGELLGFLDRWLEAVR